MRGAYFLPAQGLLLWMREMESGRMEVSVREVKEFFGCFIGIMEHLHNLLSVWMGVLDRMCSLMRTDAIRRRKFFSRRRESRKRAADMMHSWLTERTKRRWWNRHASEDWWETTVLQCWQDDLWLRNFRMTRGTLFELAETLRPHLQRQDTRLRASITVEKRVAICIWWLASISFYRNVESQFGVGLSTAAGIVAEVCLAIELALLRKTVQLGDHREIMDGFWEMGFPHTVGAVDGCHISILAPKAQGEQYINRKKAYSMLLQGTVDHSGRFIDIEVGWSGRTHDAFVFRNSALWDAMEAGLFVPGHPTIRIGGVQVPPLILGDAAYPLRRWLMKPFGGVLDPVRRTFNRRFNRCRNIVERAFGRLKSRWRCLTAPLRVAEENIVAVIASCVVLHNVCEAKGHHIDILHKQEMGPPPPTVEETGVAQVQRDREEGRIVQEAIANWLHALDEHAGH